MTLNKKSIFGKIDKDVVASWVSIVSKLGVGVIVAPLVLRFYDAPDANMWLFLVSITTFQVAADFGFSQTAIRYYGAGESSASDIYASFKKQFIRIALSGFIVILALTYFPYNAASSQLHESGGYLVAWLMVVFLTAVMIFGNLYSSALYGLGRIASFKFREAIINFIALIATISMIGLDIPLAYLVLPIPLANGLNVYFNRKEARLVIREKGEKKGGEKVEIWPAVWRSGLGVLFSFSILQFMIMSGVSLLDARDASENTFQIRLMMLVVLLSQAPFYTKIPAMARYYKEGCFVELRGLVFAASAKSLLSYVVLCASIILFLKSSIPDIIGIDLNYKVSWAFFILGFFFERLGGMAIQVYTLTNVVLWHKINGLVAISFVAMFLLFIDKYLEIAYSLSFLGAYSLVYFPVCLFFFYIFWRRHAKG